MDSRSLEPKPELPQAEAAEAEVIEVEEVAKEAEEEKEVEEEEVEEVEIEEEEDQLPPEEELENPLSKDSTLMETQSRKREEETENTEEETTNTRVKIDKTVLVEPEERERKEENTKRRERPLKVKSSPKKRRSPKLLLRNQRSSMRPLENPLMISLETTLLPEDKLLKPELLKVSKVSKPNKVFHKTLLLTPPSIKKLMLPTTSLLELEPTLWVSVLSNSLKMTSQCHQEVEEVAEEAEVEEVEEETVKPLTLDKEDKIQSKPSRKLKKISQPYEREDLFDLPSKELADSFMVDNRLLIVLKRFF